MPAHRLLLASIHDVSPRFEGEIDRLTELLKNEVGDRFAMLVVPNHWGDSPIVPGSNFASKLRAWADLGVEMFLHGFFHRDAVRHGRATDRMRAGLLTAGEGEFLGLTRDQAKARIGDGTALIEDVIGRPIAGFVAPAWLYGAGAHEALADCAVAIAEDHWRVWSPVTGAELARGPVITWASRTRLRRASSLIAAATLRAAPIDVLRIGLHPADIGHPRLIASIGKTLRSAASKRQPARYADLPAS